MQLTRIVRRLLGDLIGLTILAALVAALIFVLPDAGTTPQRWRLFFMAYVALAVSGYVCWIQMGKRANEPRWLLAVLYSLGAGAVLIIPDILLGLYRDHSLSLLEAAASTGIMFAITLFFCPGFTFIALSGWVRSFVVSSRTALS